MIATSCLTRLRLGWLYYMSWRQRELVVVVVVVVVRGDPKWYDVLLVTAALREGKQAHISDLRIDCSPAKTDKTVSVSRGVGLLDPPQLPTGSQR